MAVTANVFANALDQMAQAKINWPSDTIKMALLTSSYTPNLTTNIHWSDISTNETSGTGYTAGGAALASVAHAVTGVSSWGTSWSATTWTYGQIIKSGSYLYRCVTAGTSTGSAPSFPTVVGQTVTDSGGVEWANAGESITIWSSAAVTWSTSTISAQYAVIYDATPVGASNQPLIASINFGSTLSSTGAAFTVTPDPTLGWFNSTPA